MAERLHHSLTTTPLIELLCWNVACASCYIQPKREGKRKRQNKIESLRKLTKDQERFNSKITFQW